MKDNKDFFHRLIIQTALLFDPQKGQINQVEAHEMKSILYTAIERVGFSVEQLSTVQRLLRELFAIINLHEDIRSHEREVGLQILENLIERYSSDFIVACINQSNHIKAQYL